MERSSPSIASEQVWTLSDGRAGNLRQAAALAAALGIDTARNWTLTPTAPWRWTAPRGLPGSARAFGDAFAKALATPPRLAIGCGRQAALATRLLRRRGAKVIQILDPRIDPRHWDVVIAPEHDHLQGDNVVAMLGSLHPVNDRWLDDARERFSKFTGLPRPRTALLLGGPSAHARFDGQSFAALAKMIDKILARDGGCVLATTSRRTPDDVAAALRERFAYTSTPRWPGLAWCGPDDGENLYPGILAWADRIVCTADSVNMLSEACATRVPVHVFAPESVDGRPRHFIDTLLARGRIRALDLDMATTPDVEPLHETARVAAAVHEHLGL